MPPKKRQNDDTKDEKFVYVLTLKTWSHGGGDPRDVEVVGVFANKAAAVAAAGDIDSDWGTFDYHIPDGDFGDHYIDNRENPPDNGILLKLGDDDHGEGDYAELNIQKFEVQGGATTRRAKKAK